MVRLANSNYTLDIGISQLKWRTVFDLDGFMVSDLMPLSPVARALAGWPCDGHGVIFEAAPRQGVLTWQADRGFVGIAEGHLQCLAKALGVEDLSKSVKGIVSRRDAIILALAKYLLGELSHERAKQILLSASVVEDTQSGKGLDFLTDEVVDDVLLVGDHELAREVKADVREAKKARQNAHERVEKLVAAIIPRPTKRPKVMSERQRQQATQRAKAKRHEWLRAFKGDPDESVVRFAPVSCRVVVDPSNGRFLCYQGVSKRRSISWTQRGHSAAALLALQTMWEWHFATTGEMPPDEVGFDMS